MTDIKTDALICAMTKMLIDYLKGFDAEHRAALLPALLDAYHASGSKSFVVTLPDGAKVGTVTLTEPSAGAVVTDPDALDAWIATAYPHAVVHVPAHTEVPASFRDSLLKHATVTESGELVDEQGEVMCGVAWRAGGEPTSMRIAPLTAPQKALLAEAWSRGDFAALAPGVAPQLTEGSTE